MRMNNLIIVLVAAIFANLVMVSGAYAADMFFTGTALKTTGEALNNTNISVIIRNQSWAQVGFNSTASNATGIFNLSMPQDSSYMYQISMTHTNSTTSVVDYVGQSLPDFPYFDIAMMSNITFYLKPAATINITAVNSSGSNIQFAYQIKDTKLGFPIASAQTGAGSVLAYVQAGRNYSIMIYPAQGSGVNFVPVSFDWSNFSSTDSYTIADNIGLLTSRYNGTTKVLSKQFNVSESMAWISGNFTDGTYGITGWSDFRVVPYLFESSMVSLSYGALPYNASRWAPNSTDVDVYNNATGFYNISLPYAPAETVRYLLFASAKNGTEYFGSYRNITVSGNQQLNFTAYGLLGIPDTISVQDAMGGGNIGIETERQYFYLLNASDNSSLSNLGSHIEVVLDYSDYNATEFTVMIDLSAPNNGNYSLPLINSTGIKEMNIYDMSSAPKRVDLTAAEIIANNNITMSSFQPGDIDGKMDMGGISIIFYKANSTCDIPMPAPDCVITSSENMDSFNPMTAVMGGGDVSMRMSIGDISVHYSNVDMLASGPPDALFDNSTSTAASGDSFSAALRFGSMGPTIYDFVLVGIPYTETAGSGLNDSAEVNMTIPTFYDENWNVIWNTSTNGTNATFLAGNYSHYESYSSQWQTLMGNITCLNNTVPNITHPCSINTTDNKIWIRLPHFSGTQPSIDGTLMPAASGDGSSGGGGGGGGAGVSSKQVGLNTKFAESDTYRSNFSTSDKATYEMVDGTVHTIKVIKVASTEVTLSVSSDPYNITLGIGEAQNIDLDADGSNELKITLNAIADSKADLTFTKLAAVVAAPTPEETPTEETPAGETPTEETPTGEEAAPEETPPLDMGVIAAVIIAIIAIGAGAFYLSEQKKKPWQRKKLKLPKRK